MIGFKELEEIFDILKSREVNIKLRKSRGVYTILSLYLPTQQCVIGYTKFQFLGVSAYD